MRRLGLATTVLLASSCAAGPQGGTGALAIDAALWAQLVAAEDARIATRAQHDLLREALASSDPSVRAVAVRAFGRSERPEHASLIVPLLSDGSDTVRAAAAHALGDVSRDTASAQGARTALLAALPQPGTTGAAAAAIAETVGRLTADAAAARVVAGRLAPFLAHDDPARLGALRGLYFLSRQTAARPAVAAAAADALRALARTGRDPRERGLAVVTLAAIQAADEPTLRAALEDAESQVRREAALAAATVQDTAAVRRLLEHALADPAPPVRYDALRTWVRRLAGARGCRPVSYAMRDPAAHVALLAIDLAGSTCRSAAHVPLLDSIAAALTPGATAWHHGAHAVAALALVDPARARPRVHALAQHPVAFARMYAAAAARAASDTALLYQLARDTSANVRTAAVAALAATAGRAADSVYVAQLASLESELLMAVAAALEGSPDPRAADRLLDALDRVSVLRRETSRDARLALLDRAQQLGSRSRAGRVRSYLNDFDPAVAARAAAVLEAWTGERHAAAPRPLPLPPVPTYAQAARLAAVTFVLEMRDGGEIAIRLLPFDAPTNAARFARLARAGYFDGLTLHRVVPNFVVQGGSPGANEYSGDGPFTRDELGVPNWGGTVGLSTRGRDTGDAQFYINLVDNVRLDHEYTVFGVVTSGMDVVDSLREGAVIRRVREAGR